MRFLLVCLLTLSAAIHAFAAEQKISFNVGVEPRSLDPHIATGVPEAHIILNMVEGLTRTDEKGQAIPAIAKTWDISPDGKTYTFHLRPAQWSNGEPVTAEDFVFAWRRCLAPATASEYAYQLFFVTGAEEYNAGKSKDPTTIGAKALTTSTLEVTLKNPTPFFLSALAHYAYSPLKESWVEAHPQFAAKAVDYLCNGPFVFAEWRHGDRIILRKNPKYYNAQQVKLDSIVMTMVKNESTAVMQWESGQIDVVDNLIPLPDVPRLKKEGKYNSAPYLGVYYVGFNHKRKPFTDARVRRALSLAINRSQITEAILRGGQKPALALVPPGIVIDGKDYRASGGDLFKEDLVQAKKLLAEAGYPNGRGFPKVKYLYNDREDHRIIAQALQNMWATNLGIKVDLDVQEWKVYIQNKQRHQFDSVRGGWIGDYVDPITFLDMFYSRSGNNDVDYRNPQYDALIEAAKVTSDTVQRLASMRAAEKKAISEDMAIAPVFFYVSQYLQKPNIKGLVRNPLGYVYFDKAYVE